MSEAHRKIRVLHVKPGEYPRAVEVEDTLDEYHKLVEGHIEVVMVTSRIVMVCNDEGKVKDMQPNFFTAHDVIVGPVFFCGAEGEDFVSLTPEQAGTARGVVIYGRMAMQALAR